MSIESSLDSALRQFDQPEAALTALLAAWNESRSPDVAVLVERAGARVPRPALETKPPDKALGAWLTCARKRDPADLDRLIAALQAGKVKEIIERLKVLAAAPKDPRLTSLAATLLETQPFRSGAARPIYTSIIALLEAQDDPRTLQRLETVKARFMPGKGLEGGSRARQSEEGDPGGDSRRGLDEAREGAGHEARERPCRCEAGRHGRRSAVGRGVGQAG
jgi:hypothetical protein